MCIRGGLDPDSFWGYTLAEASSYMKGIRERDDLAWNHTSSLMALYAQSKAKRGKKITLDDFHPYRQMEKEQPELSPNQLLDKFKNF
jgi:hypothetical protein